MPHSARELDGLNTLEAMEVKTIPLKSSFYHPGVITHLDILLETPYLHLGCLLKNNASASNCCKGPWTY
jgi:hypothetical protein